jgi:hypothetical protein
VFKYIPAKVDVGAVIVIGEVVEDDVQWNHLTTTIYHQYPTGDLGRMSKC